MNPEQLFDRWFTQSIAKLKELPTGDGAFAAFIIALPLYERFIVGELKLTGSETKEDNVKQAVASDLNLGDRERSIFWEMFRNGFMHQAMAKDGKTKWMVSHTFGALPEFKEIDGVNYILIDPWKFADRVIAKYRDNPSVITASDSFPLASIFELSTATPGDADRNTHATHNE